MCVCKHVCKREKESMCVCVCVCARALWRACKGLVDMFVDLDDMLSALHNHQDVYVCVCVCET